MPLELSFASSRNPRVAALLDGKVAPEGIQLHLSELQAPDIFWRQLHHADFDVSEMSLSSLLMLLGSGRRDYLALPVFPDRRFFHTLMLARTDSGIDSPEDLKGRPVGVPDFQQTAALWTRAVLFHSFGVHAEDMEWFMERLPALSHAGGVGFQVPENVNLSYIPESESIGSRLVDGQLDAAIVYEPALLFNDDPTMLDRSPPTLPEDSARWLFPDQAIESQRAFEAFGFVPANHCIVVRASVVDRHPWVALNLFNALVQSRNLHLQWLEESLDLHRSLGVVQDDNVDKPIRDATRYPYGVHSNRTMLDMLASESARQGLTSEPLGLEEVFAPSTLDI